MSAACPCGGACLCHGQRSENRPDLTSLVGAETALTPTGRALVGCLAPGRTLHRYEAIWQAIRPGVDSAPDRRRHALAVHVYHANRALAPIGLRIVVAPAVGLELVTCEPREAAAVRKRVHPWRASPLRRPDRREAFVAVLRAGLLLVDAYRQFEISESTVRRARARWPEFNAEVQRALKAQLRKRRQQAEMRLDGGATARPGPAATPVFVRAPAENRSNPVTAAPASQTKYSGILAPKPNGRPKPKPCGMVGCDQLRAGHLACSHCGQRAGAGHAVVDLEDGGLCRWCAEQEHGQARIAAGRPRPVQWTEHAFA